MRMTLNDIGKALRKVLSAVARAAWGITLCAGGLAVGIAGEILLGVLNFMFGILTALLSIVTIIWTAKRNSKTAAQQCRFYEVDNIFEYMVETYINGNFGTFREIYKELCKDARKDFIDFLLSEVEPIYWREILKETI